MLPKMAVNDAHLDSSTTLNPPNCADERRQTPQKCPQKRFRIFTNLKNRPKVSQAAFRKQQNQKKGTNRSQKATNMEPSSQKSTNIEPKGINMKQKRYQNDTFGSSKMKFSLERGCKNEEIQRFTKSTKNVTKMGLKCSQNR